VVLAKSFRAKKPFRSA